MIQNILVWIHSSRYALLFLGAFVEGPVVMMSAGFLWKIGQLSFFPMYMSLVLGDFFSDIGWYSLGRFGARKTVFKFGRFFGITQEGLIKVEKWFHKYHQKILIISKLTMGFGLATIILAAAGIYKTPFKNYALINLIFGFAWVIFLIIVGYFVGNAFYLVPESYKIVLSILVISIFFVAVRILNNYLKRVKI